MRKSQLKNPNNSHKQQKKFPVSQLTILIKIKQSSTIPRLLLKPRCPLPTDLLIIPPKESTILRSQSRRKTIGQISLILKREDAFRIELHRENSVSIVVESTKTF